MPGNILKLIAAASMLIDHMGLLFFPDQIWMRAVGRLAFPIFAFFIAEGFRYTRSRIRYLLTILSVGMVCQLVDFIVTRRVYLCVLITFSFSVSLLLLLDKALNESRTSTSSGEQWFYTAAFLVAFVAVAVICHYVEVDYGLCGVMLPLWPSFAKTKWGRLGAFACGMVPLCLLAIINGMPVQLFAYAALLPLALYNGKPGRPRLKYFFYVFYPVHLAVLRGIRFFLS
ncbi:MAG: hypothetical protein HFE78_05260 [Clostridiales bacterium]|nr:hypothetical protein [Clostridiales bacterium]